jgi:fucose 4-O-acetylase-like acetyltransferase
MPSRETLWFVPLLVVCLLVAMCFTIFLSPAIGVPLLVLAGIFGAIGWFGGNRTKTADVERFREQVPYESGTDFTARDRESLTRSDQQ